MDLDSSGFVAILLLEVLLHLLELALVSTVHVAWCAVLPPRVSAFEQSVAFLQDFRVGMLPVRLHNFHPADPVQLEAGSAHEVGHVPLLH